MTLSVKEIALLTKAIESGLGSERVKLKVYFNEPVAIKISDTQNPRYFFVVQHLDAYVVTLKPQRSDVEYACNTFEEVVMRLVDWQIDIA